MPKGNKYMSLKGKAEGSTIHGKINTLNTLRGYSAYEVALINGFEGTEEEWLASLKGDKGDKGDSYIITEADKTEIANIVLANFVDVSEVGQ